MIHLLALLMDLVTDEQCMHALARHLFASGVMHTALIFLLGGFAALRHRKLWNVHAHSPSSSQQFWRHSS